MGHGTDAEAQIAHVFLQFAFAVLDAEEARLRCRRRGVSRPVETACAHIVVCCSIKDVARSGQEDAVAVGAGYRVAFCAVVTAPCPRTVIDQFLQLCRRRQGPLTAQSFGGCVVPAGRNIVSEAYVMACNVVNIVLLGEACFLQRLAPCEEVAALVGVDGTQIAACPQRMAG